MRRGVWPAHWVRLAGEPAPPFVSAYRLRWEGAVSTRIHVGADERYILFVDGERVGRGNDRGHLDRWFFDSYDLELGEGRHEIFAYVWSLGDLAPYAQMSLRPGFLLADEGGALTTGEAAWEGARLEGFEFLPPLAAWGNGAKMRIEREPTGPYGSGRPAEWGPVEKDQPAREIRGANDLPPSRLLAPSMIPAQYEAALGGIEVVHVSAPLEGPTSRIPLRSEDQRGEEVAGWEAVLRGGGDPVVVPAGERRRVIVRLPTYAFVYTRVRCSGSAGSRVRVHVQEALFENFDTWDKGDRREIEGKFFTTIYSGEDGIGDEFGPRGFKQDFATFWWTAGRYAEILVESGEKSTAVFEVGFDETRYPLELDGWPETDDPRMNDILKLCRRSVEMSAHETFVDCGYEGLQYILDARIEGLLAMVFGADDRLVRKALVMFADSILPSGPSAGLTQSRFPSRVRQVIPPFSLHFIGMVHDFATWRGDEAFVRSLMPTVRRILDYFASLEDKDGVLRAADGWNFVDWVPGWSWGMPPGLDEGPNPFLGLMLWRARRQAESLAAFAEGAALSWRGESPAAWIVEAADGPFGDTEQFATLLLEPPTTLGGDLYAKARRVLTSPATPTRGTFAFLHQTFLALGPGSALRRRIEAEWGPLVENGLATTIEMPEPTRSDCHGWGAHPAYHLTMTGLALATGMSRDGTRQFVLYGGTAKEGALAAKIYTETGPLIIRQTHEGDRIVLEGEVPLGTVVFAPSSRLGPGPFRIEREERGLFPKSEDWSNEEMFRSWLGRPEPSSPRVASGPAD